MACSRAGTKRTVLLSELNRDFDRHPQRSSSVHMLSCCAEAATPSTTYETLDSHEVLLHLSTRVDQLQHELKLQQAHQQATHCQLESMTAAVDKHLEELEKQIKQIRLDKTDRIQSHHSGQHKQSSTHLEHGAEAVSIDNVHKEDGDAYLPSERSTAVRKASRTTLSLSTRELDKLVTSTRPFDDSVWEVATVIGTGCLTAATSGFLWIILVLTVFVQVTYINIGGTVFTFDWFTDKQIRGFHDWRHDVGHSIQFSDNLGTPLVKSVCAASSSVTIGAQQIAKKTIVDAYLKGAMPHGVILCLVALLLWHLSIFVSFLRVADFGKGMLTTKKGANTEILVTSEGRFVIYSFSNLRICGVMFLCAARLVLVLTLGWIGTFYIVYTEQLTDLIIKSLALQAVLRVDSLLFVALVPSDASALIKQLAPLPLP